MGLGNAVRQNIPDVDEVIRYSPDAGNFRIGDELFHTEFNNVDPSFFKVFTFEFVEGHGDLGDKSKICISDELAVRYFGAQRPLASL